MRRIVEIMFVDVDVFSEVPVNTAVTETLRVCVMFRTCWHNVEIGFFNVVAIAFNGLGFLLFDAFYAFVELVVQLCSESDNSVVHVSDLTTSAVFESLKASVKLVCTFGAFFAKGCKIGCHSIFGGGFYLFGLRSALLDG